MINKTHLPCPFSLAARRIQGVFSDIPSRMMAITWPVPHDIARIGNKSAAILFVQELKKRRSFSAKIEFIRVVEIYSVKARRFHVIQRL